MEPLLGCEVKRATKSLDSPRGLMVEGVPGEVVLACARLSLSVSDPGIQAVRRLGLPWASWDGWGLAIHVP